MVEYKQQWSVPSSDGQRTYTVSLTMDGQWQCGCRGWTTHINEDGSRNDCTHIKKKKAELGINSKPRLDTPFPVKTSSGATIWSPRAIRAAEKTMTKEAALKAGATPEQATDAARAKREEVQAKKAAKLDKMRYGFQLAEEPHLSEMTFTRPMVAEIKYDGHLAMIIDGKIINRSGRDITLRFPEIEKVNGPAVLVGELIVPNEQGLGDFSGGIQTRNTDNPEKIKALSRDRPAMFVAFDVLEVAGEDVTKMPFSKRRVLLEAFYTGAALVGANTKVTRHQLIEQVPVTSKADILRLRKQEADRGGEGIMIKDLDAPYTAKRGRNWIKVKCWSDAVFTIESYQSTGVGDGFTIMIKNRGREQTVVVNDHKMREQIRKGHKKVEVKYLSEGEDGALRFPSIRRLTER